MIVRNLTIKIQGNRATTDSPLYLHTQDKNIHIAINVVNSKFEIKDDMLLSFTIIKPNGEEVDKADCYIKNKQCHLLLNGAEFDEETEVGTHLVQMKLYDEFRQARLSLPPFAMHVLKSSGEFYADDEVEGLQAEQNAYKLMTENRLALEMNESILISDLPTTTEVQGYVPVTNGDTTYKLDMSQVATKDELEHNHDTVYAPKEHNHDAVYAPINHEHEQLASKTYVANAIADAQLSGEGTEIDLSGYATKDDLLTKADKQHTHDNQYAPKTHSHEEYALAEHTHNYSPTTHTHSYNDLTNKPTIPSIDGLATETYVDDAIANAQLGGEDIDLTNYVTKEELATKADKEHSHEQYLEEQDLTDYALKTDLPTHTSDLINDSGFIKDIPLEYVTESELQAKGYLTSQTVVRIEVVDELPTTQEYGVLYIVKAGE